jgi:hypothetical protein
MERVHLGQVRARRWRDAVLAEERHVRAHHRDHHQRQRAHVQRVEAGQRRLPVVVTADDRALQPLPHQRHARRDVGRDLGRPVPLLIPRQQVPGQRQSLNQPEQREADPPGHLARALVRAVEHHLQHVEPEHDHHRLRAVVMEAADQPPERDLVLQVVDARPRVLHGRRVGRHHQQAGDHLHHEDHRERATEDVRPARPAPHLFVERVAQERAVPRPIVEERQRLLDHQPISTLSDFWVR